MDWIAQSHSPNAKHLHTSWHLADSGNALCSQALADVRLHDSEITVVTLPYILVGRLLDTHQLSGGEDPAVSVG